jgi:ABC-2 type transport system permease protein
MRAFLAVAWNEWVQVWRDRWYLLLITVGAMSTLVTLAYTLSTDIEGVTTLVVNLDNGRHGRQFVQSLANDAFFTLEAAAQRDEAERRLQEGSAKVGIVIPVDLTRRVDRGETVRVQMLIDGSEPGVAELAHNHVSVIANSVSQQLVIDELRRQGVSVPTLLRFHPCVRYNADLETIVSVVPGLMAVVLIVPSVGASAAFARERERGSFELVISTPLGRWPLLLGRVFPYVLIGLFDIGVFTAIGRFVFGVPLRGNLGLFVVLGLVYIFATASSGVFIAQFLRTQHAAAIVTFELFGIAPTYISDIFFPVSSMPVWLQWLSALQPATHFTVVARGVFLKGVGWDVLWPNGLALLAMGVVMSALAYARFQKKLV